jgi:EAL domain-containing protein (putative c-di-GMP-specific phosphodiesterase class I)
MLHLEITESALIDQPEIAATVMQALHNLGVKLALDDFGTGYSSMDVLRHIPFDKIKLDRSFVQDIESDPQSLAILHAMVELGRSLAIPVLVEGVETERQMAILRASGCRKVQGYLTGKPAPASAIVLGQAETVEAFKQAG